MKNIQFWLYLSLFALLVAGCAPPPNGNGGERPGGPGGSGGDVAAPEADLANAIDLTNQTLESTDPNCASYVGTYTSMIEDETNGNEFEGLLIIATANGECQFSTNQIPNHDLGGNGRFATDVSENNTVLSVTADPQFSSTKTSVSMGASVIMLNGVKWEPYPAACFDAGSQSLGQEANGCEHDEVDHPWRYDIGSSLNKFGFDEHKAHVQPMGVYHYHSSPTALYDAHCEGHAPSPVIGFAADGFPVYGPCFTDESGAVRTAVSSFQVKSGIRQDIPGYTTPYRVGNVQSDSYDGQFIGDYEYVAGLGDLDECNGMTVNGVYGYYVTESYPYVLACYSGTPNQGFR